MFGDHLPDIQPGNTACEAIIYPLYCLLTSPADVLFSNKEENYATKSELVNFLDIMLKLSTHLANVKFVVKY